jgi:predicted TIM-barrel fold metal-dependent hydrolase
MNPDFLSRRQWLYLTGAALAGGTCGGGCQRSPISGPSASASGPSEIAAAQPRPLAVKDVIDVHVHVVSSNMPGVPKGGDPEDQEFGKTPEETAKIVQAQMKAAGVTRALCMPSRKLNGDDALGVAEVRQMAKLAPGLHPIGLADPERFDEEHLEKVEESLKQKDIVALKAFLGYLHYGPDAPGYRPYYELAAKYDIPVIFHTGDTYSHLAKVRFAHPLLVDEVAVDFPDTKFVLAHMGNPWLMDTAEVIYKNNKPGFRENVWADFSGLLVGTAEIFEQYRQQGALKTVIHEVRKAIEFCERPDRLLYGSDWPLAPMQVYRDFIAELVPQPMHQAVFHDNAKTLFKLA